MIFKSRACRQFRSAEAKYDPEVDTLSRKFLTQGGPDFWTQLAAFLAAFRNAMPGLLYDLSRHPLCDGLADFSDDDDIQL
jgi:hypothetical protein